MRAVNYKFDEVLLEILEYAPSACLFLDASFTVINFNNIAAAILRQENLKGKHLEDIFPEVIPGNGSYADYIREHVAFHIENGRSKISLTAAFSDGTSRPMEAVFMPMGEAETGYIVHLRAYEAGAEGLSDIMEDKRNLEMRLTNMIDYMPLVCNTFNKDFNIIDCNQKAVEVFEMKSKQDFIDRFPEISPPTQPCGTPSMEKAVACIARAFDEGYYSFEWMDQKLDGAPMPSHVTLIRFEWKHEHFVVAFIQDLREFYRFREAERIAKARLKTMLDSSPLACFIIEENKTITELNQEFESLFGSHYNQEYMELFSKLSPTYQPDGRRSDEKCREKMEMAFSSRTANFEWMFHNAHKELIPCEVTMVRVTLEGRFCVITFIRDLREIKSAAMKMQQLEMLAYTDTLTNIYNRRYFMDCAMSEMEKKYSSGKPFAIIMIDIDRFKSVNDTYGHGVGDEVLKILAIRMNSVVKRNTIVARYGGEEFAVLVSGADSDIGENIAWRIQKAVAASPFNVKDTVLHVTVSVGVCSADMPVSSLADVLARADKALYEAKNSGRNTVVVYKGE